MLETLRIQNYALIDAVEIDFQEGFNVLTGETGAGKSILVGALNLVLGARASSDVVRKQAKRAQIEASFRFTRPPSRRLKKLLKEYDLDLEDESLLLSRVVSSDGRSKAYAAGTLIPVSVLSAIGDELVDLHGQHEHQSLLKSEQQLELLDAFAGTEKLCAATEAAFSGYRDLEKEIEGLATDERDKNRRLEFYRFEVEEIEKAGLVVGEEEELKSRLKLISNAEEIVRVARQAYAVLYENESGAAIDGIGAAARDLDRLADLEDQFAPLAKQLDEVRNGLEAVAMEIRAYTDSFDFSPEELDEVNQRLVVINGLKRKYGNSIEEILAYNEKAKAEIQALESRDERLEALEQKKEALRAQAMTEAKKLSKKRSSAVKRLDKKVSAALQDLGMKGARFETKVEESDLGPRGLERVQFLLAANLGESLKPLRQVASGGEISRIMLALKTVFAGADSIATLIFDEIDAGVGGAVARKVAQRMRDLAQSHQVLCITHLAQIAAASNSHFRVIKTEKAGKVHTSVKAVQEADRVQEVARLLDGSATQVSQEHAQALLAEF